MKLSKKLYISTAALVVAGAIYLTVPTVLGNKLTYSIQQAKLPTINQPIVSAEALPSVQGAETVATPSTPPAETAPLAYGEDPENPGTFKVFNTTAVMDEADIAEEDRQYVAPMMRGGAYKVKDSDWTLFGITPATRMASAGSDYLTNPVTQLKWCNDFVHARYGTWQNAYSKFLEHQF